MAFIYVIAVLLAPAAMLLVGLMWRFSPPPYQKKGLAYSTELTRNDPQAWAAAHRHCSRLWMRIGLIGGAASGILIYLFWGSLSSFWMWLIVGQMALFCVSVFMVDLFLKTQFGGNEK